MSDQAKCEKHLMPMPCKWCALDKEEESVRAKLKAESTVCKESDFTNAEKGPFFEPNAPVREWTIFDGHTAQPRLVGPDIAYAENIKVTEKSAYDALLESRNDWKRNADARWEGLVAYEKEIDRLKAELIHATKGTAYCPVCGQLGIKSEKQYDCKCGCAWMSARQQELAFLERVKELEAELPQVNSQEGLLFYKGETWCELKAYEKLCKELAEAKRKNEQLALEKDKTRILANLLEELAEAKREIERHKENSITYEKMVAEEHRLYEEMKTERDWWKQNSGFHQGEYIDVSKDLREARREAEREARAHHVTAGELETCIKASGDAQAELAKLKGIVLVLERQRNHWLAAFCETNGFSEADAKKKAKDEDKLIELLKNAKDKA